MKINLHLYGFLRTAIGSRQIELEVDENSSIGDLPEILVRKYGNEVMQHLYGVEEPFEDLRVLINGLDYAIPDDLKKIFKENDVITLLPPLSGGIGGICDTD